ncbi:Bax inhibitor-1/YccA family protein [Streptomyces sp. TLI_105]|uniref:Bax inhibitor-1/YccA family membrane protein n=1 Tax=Streptomyces sp. TLI_105 TaxID=1881019 RepID=UPI0008957C6D|nr:Bax inhibitor-1/YccA family protein [Streptomyces sp. TLI_105]SEE58655.1 Uncharacterized membrane protein, YccA/Bax inhibitor family [Streptomyces sp. TLI_105]
MAFVEQPTLKSSNPILSRPQFGRRGGQKTAAGDPRTGMAIARDRLRTGADLEPGHGLTPPFSVGDLMTTGTVLPRAAASLGVTALATVLSWTALPIDRIGAPASYGIATAAAVLATVLVVRQRRSNLPSPFRTLLFAAVQGLFLGTLSRTAFHELSLGLLVQTVLGTITASAGVLIASGLHWTRANRRIHAFVGAALLGLPLHLRQVEKGIMHGACRDQSWPTAFGLTLTLVWLYAEAVRLLTLHQGDDFS